MQNYGLKERDYSEQKKGPDGKFVSTQSKSTTIINFKHGKE